MDIIDCVYLFTSRNSQFNWLYPTEIHNFSPVRFLDSYRAPSLLYWSWISGCQFKCLFAYAHIRSCLHRSSTMEEIYKRTLAKVLTKFKFEIKLKEEQQSVLFSILEKKDVFALLPTGFGKSRTYILMPLLADEVSVCSFCAARLFNSLLLYRITNTWIGIYTGT